MFLFICVTLRQLYLQNALTGMHHISQNKFIQLFSNYCQLTSIQISKCMSPVGVWGTCLLEIHILTPVLQICNIILLIQASSHKLIVVPGTSSWLSSAPESSQVHRILPHHYTVWTETAASQHASCSCSFIGKWAVVSVNHFALIES